MKKLQGIAVSPGVAIGEAMVFGHEGFRIPKRFVLRDVIDPEIERLNKAIAEATAELAGNRDSVAKELGQKYGDIFEAHLQILNDTKLCGEFVELIREKAYSAEYAISVTLRRYADVFRRLKNAYLAERINDIFDIEKRLLRLLLGQAREGLQSLSSEVLVLAANLTPSETAHLNRKYVRGFVTETGGPGSHTAIVAQALEIPAIVGIGAFLTEVSGGDIVIIDGDAGTVIIRPDDETLENYRAKLARVTELAVQLGELRDLEAATTDGVKIELMGNIEFPSEAEHCLERGAAGIGLYRTEFIYLGSTARIIPSEEDHFNAYRSVAETMGARVVTIRTFDLGADKIPHLPNPTDERNPALGLRSIRLSLKNVTIFRQQLRAILRASHYGNIRIMFPLITTLLELRQAKMLLADVCDELHDEKIPYDRDMKIGMMVEVPAAVIMLDHFAKEVDFLSIGTNDLIQYALAVDRSNLDVANLYHSEDPAVLKLIRQTIHVANNNHISVSLCGQMSSEPIYAMLLMGLGLRQFSVSPHILLEIKQVIRSVSMKECEKIAAKVTTLDNYRDVRNYLQIKLLERVRNAD
ncbi:MAG: phosphoenolpyruvate--protein phosphotransferase [Planctomycetaceae bacterium]|jgi:phosphotransferase system enzyme I (PtsI)|nr:phosphoenolpyruvate--protein phosphotransferase [Planctomycetaceae bacterium]